MPSNWLYMDTSFPTFTGQETVREQVVTIQNYLFMLVEEMRYSLRNLDGKNFNAAGLDRIGEAITRPVYARIQDQDENITQLQVEATGLAARIGDAEGNINQLQVAANSLSVTLANAQGDITQLQATAQGLTTRISNAEGSITTLTTTADGFRRDFTSLTGRFTTIEETVNGVTYTGPDGKVWLNNGSIDLTGAITWADLNSEAQGKVSAAQKAAESAQSTASSAQSTANSAQSTASSASSAASSASAAVSNLINQWGYNYYGTTYIDGRMLMTGTVTASHLRGGDVTLLDASGYSVGSIAITNTTTGDGLVFKTAEGGIRIEAAGDFYVWTRGNRRFGFIVDGGGANFIVSGDVIPGSSGTRNLGHSGAVWASVWASTGNIQTSDANAKHDIEPVPEVYYKVLARTDPKRFKLNDGTSDRYHVGFIAQDVEAAMLAEGLDSKDFGGFVADRDEEGNPVYMLRYTEFMPLILGYDVMHRSNIMRSDSKIVRAFTLFKTVPQQQYNMLRQALGEMQALGRKVKEGSASRTVQEDYAKARGRAGRAILGVLTAGLGIEAVNFLAALLKNRGKKYRDKDGEITWASAGQQFLTGFVADNTGMVIGGDVAAEVLTSMITGGKWYGIETPGITQISELLEDAISAGKVVRQRVQDALTLWKNGGDVAEYLRRNGGDIVGGIKDAVVTLATYAGGLPLGNLETYLLGCVQWISPEAATAYQDAMKTADKSGLKGLTGDALEVRLGDVLKNRRVTAEPEAVATLATLYEAGESDAVPTDTPDSVTVSGEEHKLNAYQRQFYDRVWADAVNSGLNELVGADWFRKADADTQAKLLKRLYDYGSQTAKAELFEDFKKDSFVTEIDQFHEVGLSTADYLEAWNVFADINSGEEKAAERATEFAYWVDTHGYSNEQIDTVKESFTVFSQIPVEPGRYDKLQAAGLTSDEAKEVSDALGSLTPEEGKETVSDFQRIREIADMPFNEDVKEMSLETVMTESAYAKYMAARDAGVSTYDYVDFLEAAREANLARGKSGSSPSQDDVEKALNGSRLTAAQKRAIWEAQGWKKESPWG